MRETEILVEQQPQQGVFVCDHAGLVINKFSLIRDEGLGFREKLGPESGSLASLDGSGILADGLRIVDWGLGMRD